MAWVASGSTGLRDSSHRPAVQHHAHVDLVGLNHEVLSNAKVAQHGCSAEFCKCRNGVSAPLLLAVIVYCHTLHRCKSGWMLLQNDRYSTKLAGSPWLVPSALPVRHLPLRMLGFLGAPLVTMAQS
eukprot:GHRQ01021430.1.p1 GENE.GHRQ01021430.1~~GHRQ01021430.1.p1  ORF type:complete len:126 (-),score=7.91 GHRQ01021430.1:754-1131(-)